MSYESDMLWVPSQANFTSFNSPTLTDVEGGISITKAGNSNTLNGMSVAHPVAPWTLTTKFDFNGSNAQGAKVYYGIHTSDGTKYESYNMAHNDTGGAGVHSMSQLLFTDKDTYSSTVGSNLLCPWFTHGCWLRLSDDTTNIIFSISKDDTNFTVVNSHARGLYATSTHIGFHVIPSAGAPSVTLTHWRVQ